MNNTPEWIKRAFIYHIYPLGLTDAPAKNLIDQPIEYRLEQLHHWLSLASSIGFESMTVLTILGLTFGSGRMVSVLINERRRSGFKAALQLVYFMARSNWLPRSGPRLCRIFNNRNCVELIPAGISPVGTYRTSAC